MFRNQFSETIFNQKYRHEGCLTWSELSKTLVDDVCSLYRNGINAFVPSSVLAGAVHNSRLTQDEHERLIQYVTDMKFIPGGRYLYYAGRPKKFFNNCFRGSERFFTDKGLKCFTETVGQNIHVLSPVSETFVPAIVKSFGIQDVYRYTLANVKGHQTKTWTVEATENHKWPLVDGRITTNLKVDDVIKASAYCALEVKLAFLHGLIFADGNVHVLKDSFGHQLRLCGDKAKYLPEIESIEGVSVSFPEFAGNDPVIYFNSTVNFKELPTTTNVDYTANFLRGWAGLDGHFSTVNQLHTIDEKAIDYFIEYAPLAGYIVSGNKLKEIGDTNFGKRINPLYRVNFRYASCFNGFKVINKALISTEEVYCVVEPQAHEFVLENGIRTSNCYLLRALEDTREDWADLSKRAETCLATGGGIGVDYSVYRCSGSILHGTGGIASGPISKMLMINEIGRQIMQGGSRRSAIYASLNWQHGDAKDFLKVKNWKDYPIGRQKKEDNSPYTLWDAKQEDFNFPAPLDMTNISINYDTNWLMNYWNTGKLDEVFMLNVRQALSTAEPGFSFNFFDKENETLRNACTEVTSEDDSDVCNLGSVNLSRISSLSEFADVVNLSTKFLVCGTLVADLPYAKVGEVREKNRRLGLGLMGIHEWLIQRNYKYEVTPELHRWLTVYRDISRATANKFCDKLGISKPVACRAIAPTGTIGILAGTTTGIEPLFAVAYKRRYLKGTTWHYQYVVDGAAKDLADTYGKDPDTLDSAISLAGDYERRIKFQADVQDYVDMAISSTINLPAWGTKLNNEDKVEEFANTLARYAHRLRGFTCYPDGSRGGQPLTPVSYKEAVDKLGTEFQEAVTMHDICDITQRGGVCGV